MATTASLEISTDDHATRAGVVFAHPQPGVLYLDPGETYPVRVQYLISADSRAPAWSLGDRITDVDMLLTIQEESVVTGLNVGSAVAVTLPHDITVVTGYCTWIFWNCTPVRTMLK